MMIMMANTSASEDNRLANANALLCRVVIAVLVTTEAIFFAVVIR
jgi:hypothetical protein